MREGTRLSGQHTERERPEGWADLVPGGRFMDRFLPSPIRNDLTSDTWGVDAVKPRDILNGIEHPDWSYWGGNIRRASRPRFTTPTCTSKRPCWQSVRLSADDRGMSRASVVPSATGNLELTH